MESILDEGLHDGMLFLHHPSTWDLRRAPDIFTLMDRGLLSRFRERHISIFAYHVPLDNFGSYSTGVTLAQALGLSDLEPFSPYGGGLAGVLGELRDSDVGDLKFRLEAAVGHQCRLYQYGDSIIRSGQVGVVAGGGLALDVLRDLAEFDINVLVTGVSVHNDFSAEAHLFAQEHSISVLGGTHYSTESFACKAMVKYFRQFGLPSAFVEGEPLFEDL
jgi:putative NIF3 family GTP cyclohydrolase 1 type 2